MAFMSIDGTFMKLMVSAAQSAIYTCRKFFHAINVMVCMGKLVEFDLIYKMSLGGCLLAFNFNNPRVSHKAYP